MKWRFRICVGAIAAVWFAMGSAVTKAELLDNGNGTITDTVSGLMWLKNAGTNDPVNLPTAIAWVQQLNGSAFGGYSDWRLPSGANRDGSGPICNSAPTGANCTGTEFATLYFARLIMATNPGPFQNLRAGSYWTSTDAPSDPALTMAQDFVDGGQNPFAKTRTLHAWAVRDAGPIVLTPEMPLLYGVVSQGLNAGALILIDTQNAAVSIIGPTGFEQACGLTFDRIRLKLYLNPCSGQTGLQVIDLRTGAAAQPLPTLATGIRSMTHRPIDDRIYGVDLSPALLRMDTPAGGSDQTVVGMIDKRSVGGIATRPSDGKLFGVGMTESNIQQLFTLKHRTGSGPRDTNIGVVNANPIRALTFHPDGRLFATDGTNLLTLDTGSGAVLSRRPFHGASIGVVSGLAVTGPRVSPAPDVWLKDCATDTGAVPSSPSPCSQWWRSPDIVIDNNNDGVRDKVVAGQTNIVKVSVRNRGANSERRTAIRLYSLTKSSQQEPPRLTLVGTRTASVASGSSNTTVSFRWRAPAAGLKQGYCLAAELDHPDDRVNASQSPPLDNNKAVTCLGDTLSVRSLREHWR